MEPRTLAIPELVEILPRRHGDSRGYFAETYKEEWFRDRIADVRFPQENESRSARAGTIRGLHFQSPPFAQGKLVRCIGGAIFDVAVDIRKASPTYGKWVGLKLTAELGNQLWIPTGFAHGFCTLEPETLVNYKVTSVYSAEHDLGIAWDDSDLNIEWPEIADAALLSTKDTHQPAFATLPPHF